jgi:hypothetical protein
MKRLKIVLAGVLVFSIVSMVFAQGADEPVSKTYKVRYKTVQVFEPLVKSMLSSRGTVTVSPALNMIVVRDRPSYLTQIDSLFLQFDKPAQQFLFSIRLLLGSNDPKAHSASDSTALHQLLDPLYTFSCYEELDKVYIHTEERSQTTFDAAGGQFSGTLVADYVRGAGAPICLRQFSLGEYIRDVSGKYLKPIYATTAQLQESIQYIFSAIKHETTGKTLIVLITARAI